MTNSSKHLEYDDILHWPGDVDRTRPEASLHRAPTFRCGNPSTRSVNWRDKSV